MSAATSWSAPAPRAARSSPCCGRRAAWRSGCRARPTSSIRGSDDRVRRRLRRPCQRLVVPHGGCACGSRRRSNRAGARGRSRRAVHARPGPSRQRAAVPAAEPLLPSPTRSEAHAHEIVAGAAPGYGQVEAIRAWIQANVAYRYGGGDASTDAVATLDRGAGVCRDFAHVGMALTRALRIPARMVVGYLHGLEPDQDLHAWFEAYVGDRWYTFDATQAEPRGGRVVVAYGRDAGDVAFISNYGPLGPSRCACGSRRRRRPRRCRRRRRRWRAARSLGGRREVPDCG